MGASASPLSLTPRELQWLLAGLAYQNVQAHQPVVGLQNN
jgi:hypothetical protein